MSFILRKFRSSEYCLLKEWVTAEKWNPGLYDHLAMQFLDGFWMGELDGQPVTSFGSIQYDSVYSHLAWLIVKPEYRSLGYGYQIWNKALSSLNSKTIGLYAVKGKQEAYARKGFKTAGRTTVNYIYSNGQPYHSQNLISCKNIEIQALSNFDQGYFPSKRTQFLKRWINYPQTHSLAFVINNKIQGYGVVRPAFEGYKIGPLYANEYSVAQEIYKGLLSNIPQEQKVYIDIPDSNPHAFKLCQQFQMIQTSVLTRMYSNGEPQPFIGQKVYSATAFALG